MGMTIDEDDVCAKCGAFWCSTGACASGHWRYLQKGKMSLNSFIKKKLDELRRGHHYNQPAKTRNQRKYDRNRRELPPKPSMADLYKGHSYGQPTRTRTLRRYQERRQREAKERTA